jgi:hypothetical protein
VGLVAGRAGELAGGERRSAGRPWPVLFAARSAETQPSLIGFSANLIAAATKP